MKRTFKTVSVLALALIMLLGLSAVAYADSSVTYQGGAEKFVFLEGSEYTDSDLFEGFKGVMPGDVLTQEITIKNTYTGTDNVKIYIRAVAHDASNALSENVAAETELATMQDFLSQLTMTVKQGEKVLFAASPDELGGFKDNVLLGTFPGKSHTVLTVTLSVPIELGNKYMDQLGEVDWIFTAEEYNNAKPSDAPKTGDESSATQWFAIMAISLTAVTAMFFLLLKKKHA